MGVRWNHYYLNALVTDVDGFNITVEEAGGKRPNRDLWVESVEFYKLVFMTRLRLQLISFGLNARYFFFLRSVNLLWFVNGAIDTLERNTVVKIRTSQRCPVQDQKCKPRAHSKRFIFIVENSANTERGRESKYVAISLSLVYVIGEISMKIAR